MGFFQNLFGGSSSAGVVALQDPLPLQTVTVEKKKRVNRYGGDGKENIHFNVEKQNRRKKGNNNNKEKKKKGWGFNNKKRKNGKGKGSRNNRKNDTPSVATPAPKLSIFLQQNSELDEESLNHTIDTGSLTASLNGSLTASLTGSHAQSLQGEKQQQQPQHQSATAYVRPVTPQVDPARTRPRSAAGVAPPPLSESFPISGVTEQAEDSSGENSSVSEGEEENKEQERPPLGASAEQQLKAADPSSDTEKTAETEEVDSDVSPSSSPKTTMKKLSSADPISIPAFTEIPHAPSLLQEESSVSDPASSTDDSSNDDSASADAILTLNKLTAELTAELNSMPKRIVDHVDKDSVADSISLAADDDSDGNSHNVDDLLLHNTLEESSTNIADLLGPGSNSSLELNLDFDNTKTGEAGPLDFDYLSFVNSDIAIDNLTFGNDSANADLAWKFESEDEYEKDMHEEVRDLSFDATNDDNDHTIHPIRMEFDIEFVKQDQLKSASPANVSKQKEAKVIDSSAEAVTKRDTERAIVKDMEAKKSFDEIVNEVEETLANSQKQHSSPKEDDHSSSSTSNQWIPNGLMSTVRDDSSLSQTSTFSFTSDDFREDDAIEVQQHHHLSNPMMRTGNGLGISTITEEDEDSEDPMDIAAQRGQSKSQEKSVIENEENVEERENAIQNLRQTLTTALESTGVKSSSASVGSTTPEDIAVEETVKTESTTLPPVSSTPSPTVHSTPLPSAMRSSFTPTSSPSFSATNGPKSVLLSKSLPRPTMKKSVSWKAENEVINYLPAQAQDLQKARDLVATYERIMAALNNKRPNSSDSKSTITEDSGTGGANAINDDEKSEKYNSSDSDADLSEASSSSLSSIESLLSALSNSSSTSKESIKIAIQQITEETEKLVSHKGGEKEEEEKLGARNEILENKWPDKVEGVDTSSSSIESLLSALSQASSNSSGSSMKMVVQKLKLEAEKKVVISSKKLEEEKAKLQREKGIQFMDSSISSSDFSAAPSMASSVTSSVNTSSVASSTGTSESVKKLMKELNSERSKQARFFQSTQDMFSLLHTKQNSEQARVQILGNDWIEGLESGSSSSLSSLLSASPCSSQSTNDSSESVQYMMQALKRETERHRQRRKKIQSVREFVDAVCTVPSSSHLFSSSTMS